MKTKKDKLFKKGIQSSIEAQVIQKFITLVAILLSVMWILEIVFFNMFYENVKIGELKNHYDEVIKICEQADYKDKLNNYAFENNLNIIIASELNDIITIETASFEYNDTTRTINKITTSKEKLGDKEYVIYELGGNDLRLKTLCYFQKWQNTGNTYYIQLEVITTPLTSTNEVFVRLLIMVSVVGFIVTMFISYFLSKSISDPIQNLSRKAKQLSSGDLEVKFNSNEYREIEQLSNTLNYSIEEIKKSQNLQKEVICNISHELKTPLTMIQSYAELINDISGDDKEKREEHLKVIMEEADRLNGLIDDIMQYSKLEAGIMEYNITEFDIIPLIKKLKVFYIEKYTDKGYSFEFDLPDHPVIIKADEKRIEQVIINLVNNAINYSLDNKSIKVSLVEEDQIATFLVRDHGIGISKEDLDKIFDKHFRTVGGKRTSAGSGIGLSIVKSVLNYHGFNFGVKSEVNKGSIFYFKFPITTAEQDIAKQIFDEI